MKTLTKPFSGNSEGEFWSSAGEGGQQDKEMEVRFKEQKIRDLYGNIETF